MQWILLIISAFRESSLKDSGWFDWIDINSKLIIYTLLTIRPANVKSVYFNNLVYLTSWPKIKQTK